MNIYIYLSKKNGAAHMDSQMSWRRQCISFILQRELELSWLLLMLVKISQLTSCEVAISLLALNIAMVFSHALFVT